MVNIYIKLEFIQQKLCMWYNTPDLPNRHGQETVRVVPLRAPRGK